MGTVKWRSRAAAIAATAVALGGILPAATGSAGSNPEPALALTAETWPGPWNGSRWWWYGTEAIGNAQSMTPQEQSLFNLINDARTHPERYPPRGNTQGAAMTACPSPFQFSQQLRDIASEHSRFLAGKPINWVNTFPNMHMGPSGRLVWDAGEPMDRAGYRTFRAENVATGFATPADVLRFWMQDDGGSAWGHRNLILNCAAREAGVGHYQGGPGNQYWTLDMGTR